MSRSRGRGGRWLLAAATLAAFVGAALAQQPAPAGPRVDSVGITVADLDAAIAWYGAVFGCRVEGEQELDGAPIEALQGVFPARLRRARLRLGREAIELTQYLAPAGRPFPAGFASNDAIFQHIAIVTQDMPAAYAHLRRHRVRHASSGPQRLPESIPAASGIEAFYFRDPDGHVLEVIAFPAGKGDPRWQQPQAALFLGIDHTAIVVADTDASLRFWRDAVGLQVVGGSDNHGIEQERLNAVRGARLRITTLRGSGGPGVELLEYVAPGDGRPWPSDAQASDLWHWQTQIVVTDLEQALRAVQGAKVPLVSPGIVALADGGQALLARDGDGHAVQLSAAATSR
ncbi:MAG: VOC family protein [Planctomycetes bacterium]|nr:VOC family protein [Planctomycetota bacterium]